MERANGDGDEITGILIVPFVLKGNPNQYYTDTLPTILLVHIVIKSSIKPRQISLKARNRKFSSCHSIQFDLFKTPPLPQSFSFPFLIYSYISISYFFFFFNYPEQGGRSKFG